MVRKSYNEKLKDPRWQRKRLEALQAADWKCAACKATDKTLHVHHKKYAGEPWEVPLGWLQVLCEDCHESEHGKKEFKRLSLYLPGKIGKNDWRHSIVPELRAAFFDECPHGGGRADVFPDLVDPIVWKEGEFIVDYKGPYFISDDHGCYHGETQHGQSPKGGADWWSCREDIALRCYAWMNQATVAFCYLDDEGAYGTICELLYLKARGVPIYLGFKSEELHESYWFLDVELRRMMPETPVRKIWVGDNPRDLFLLVLEDLGGNP